jgi:hypothetical protein
MATAPSAPSKPPIFQVADAAAVAKARAALDAQTDEMMAWHFHETTGCPFWLE